MISCHVCGVRIEISNRTANAVIAGASGALAAAFIVMGAYLGQKNYDAFFTGLLLGILSASLLITVICMYAYTHSQLNKMQAS